MRTALLRQQTFTSASGASRAAARLGNHVRVQSKASRDSLLDSILRHTERFCVRRPRPRQRPERCAPGDGDLVRQVATLSGRVSPRARGLDKVQGVIMTFGCYPKARKTVHHAIARRQPLLASIVSMCFCSLLSRSRQRSRLQAAGRLTPAAGIDHDTASTDGKPRDPGARRRRTELGQLQDVGRLGSRIVLGCTLRGP